MARLPSAIVALVMSGALVACAGAPAATHTAAPTSAPTAGPTAAPTGGAPGTINVALQEWAVLPEPETTAAGSVTFAITNNGPDDTHEFVVIRTDLAPEDLPTAADGSVDEEGEGIVEVMGEIEDVLVGSSEELTLDLDPGAYVLICNIFDEDEQEAHYQEGMYTAFTVE